MEKNSRHRANYFRDLYAHLNAHNESAAHVCAYEQSIAFYILEVVFFIIIAISQLSPIENEQFTITT